MASASFQIKIRLALRHIPWLKKTYHWFQWILNHLWIKVLRYKAIVQYRAPHRVGPPTGTFSAYEELKAGRIVGKIITESQEIPKAIQGDIRNQSQLGQDGFQPWPIFWSVHSNAQLVGPSLAYVDAFKRICIESVYGEFSIADDPATHFVFHPPETRIAGSWTSLISRWATADYSYYHWLYDALPRLALLEHLPDEVNVLIPPGPPAYARESLEILGLADRARPTPESNLILETYYFCAPSAMTGCANPFGIEFLRRKFLPVASYPAFPKRFFISRRAKTRGALNETEILRFFQKHGWAIIEMEDLTLREQITLFSNAEAVCGLHGAAFSNLVWCQPGCKVLEIFSSTFLNGCYEGIANIVGCDHHFLVFEGNFEDRITVDLAKVAEVIEHW